MWRLPKAQLKGLFDTVEHGRGSRNSLQERDRKKIEGGNICDEGKRQQRVWWKGKGALPNPLPHQVLVLVFGCMDVP